MLFDMLFEVGGQAAVDFGADFFFPIYEWVCDMSVQFGGWWDTVVTGFEAILT